MDVTPAAVRAYKGVMSAPRRLILAGAVLLAVFAVLFASGAATALETASVCERVDATAAASDPAAPASEPSDPDCLRSCVIHCQSLPPAGADPLAPGRPPVACYSLTNDDLLASRTEAEDPPPRL